MSSPPPNLPPLSPGVYVIRPGIQNSQPRRRFNMRNLITITPGKLYSKVKVLPSNLDGDVYMQDTKEKNDHLIEMFLSATRAPGSRNYSAIKRTNPFKRLFIDGYKAIRRLAFGVPTPTPPKTVDYYFQAESGARLLSDTYCQHSEMAPLITDAFPGKFYRLVVGQQNIESLDRLRRRKIKQVQQDFAENNVQERFEKIVDNMRPITARLKAMAKQRLNEMDLDDSTRPAIDAALSSNNRAALIKALEQSSLMLHISNPSLILKPIDPRSVIENYIARYNVSKSKATLLYRAFRDGDVAKIAGQEADRLFFKRTQKKRSVGTIVFKIRRIEKEMTDVPKRVIIIPPKGNKPQ